MDIKTKETYSEVYSILNMLGESYIEKLLPLVENSKNEIVIFPSFTNLLFASQKLTASKVLLGAQNVNAEPKGAFTGTSLICTGHCER